MERDLPGRHVGGRRGARAPGRPQPGPEGLPCAAGVPGRRPGSGLEVGSDLGARGSDPGAVAPPAPPRPYQPTPAVLDR